MAFIVNDSAPETTDRDLVTGVVNLSVVALNPTLAELKELGRNYKEEPSYFQAANKNGHKQLQLDIWLGGEVNVFGEQTPLKVLDKVTFWLENSTSRGIYIDKFGKFGKDQSKLDASARPAYNGEVDLVQFLKALCNVRKDQEVSLDTVARMASQGDTTELRQLFTQTTKNQVRVLCGVKDGKYQVIFNKQFEYAGGTDNSYLHKQLLKNSSYVTGYFGPINLQNDQYIPGNYMARRYSAEDEQQFQMSTPQGTFGAPAGTSPFGGTPAAQPFSTAGAFPQPHFGAAPRPIGVAADADMDVLPF